MTEKKIIINPEKCVGCGECVRICPQGFEMRNRMARVIDANAECIKQAIASCPFGAISYGSATVIEENIPLEISSANPIGGAGAGMGSGRGNGGGRGRNQGTGSGLGGYCVCPVCGNRIPHQRGVPCYEMKCPKCAAKLTRG